MKHSAGFTLIELVIVIIILGILAVTAAPKFLNLQGDARASTLSGMKAAMESASSLVYSKSVLQGIEKKAKANGVGVSAGSSTVMTHYGYPTADAAGIAVAVDMSTGDWRGVSSGNNTYVVWLNSTAGNAASAACKVVYTQARTPGARSTANVISTGC